ncbi:MAG: hypothetical protein IJQ67_04060 [Bacilli bacterium]|nr:hypothetical protein [Bacilli bacterium]
MNDYRKAANDKPVLTDEQLFSGLMTISSISRALAKKVLIKATTNQNHQKGGRPYGGRKKAQRSRS